MTRTVHVLRGTRYAGAFEDSTVVDAATVPEVRGPADGWLFVTSSGGVSVLARPEDLFETEADARAEAKARRRPRQARTAAPLFGDFALLAQFSGIRTDGTGRRAR